MTNRIKIALETVKLHCWRSNDEQCKLGKREMAIGQFQALPLCIQMISFTSTSIPFPTDLFYFSSLYECSSLLNWFHPECTRISVVE